MHGRTKPNPSILTRKESDERLVLTERDARKTPDATIGRACNAEACARDCGVMRPRVVFEGVKQPGRFSEQSLVRVLQLAAPMERRW